MSFWDVKKPTTQMRQLCKSLGDQYRITIIDLERVINRDFGNGYDVEISNMNTTSLRKKARIYLWKDKKRIVDRVYDVPREDIGNIVDRVYDVPREDIGKVVDALYDKYGPNSAGCGTESSVAAAAE